MTLRTYPGEKVGLWKEGVGPSMTQSLFSDGGTSESVREWMKDL